MYHKIREAFWKVCRRGFRMQLQERSRNSSTGASARESAANNKDALEAHATYRLGLAYGRLVYRFRWFIIALWVVALVISVPFAATVSNVLTGSGGSNINSESAQASNILKSRLHEPATQLLRSEEHTSEL